jgi:hypothetical protein
VGSSGGGHVYLDAEVQVNDENGLACAAFASPCHPSLVAYLRVVGRFDLPTAGGLKVKALGAGQYTVIYRFTGQDPQGNDISIETAPVKVTVVNQIQPNKSPQSTPPAVTPPAGQKARQP